MEHRALAAEKLPQQIRPLLQNLFLPWDKLNEAEQAELTSQSRLVHYSAGENLHSRDLDCIGMLLIASGELRVYLLSEEGREITLYRLHAGEACVLSAACVLATITFEVHIDAEQETQILTISPVAFEQLLKSNIYAECYAYKLATERFSQVMWAMQQLLFISLDRRLALFLQQELARRGGDTDSLNYTHEQIARDIGSARETVSRMLKYFADEGIVELSRGDIRIVDEKKLRQLAES
jgi:CRP/FNR family transcriptional regulator, anaerobic regulatory protein